MPKNGNNQSPPKAMTWGKAMPVLVTAGIFDLARMFFEMFWFFGPAIAAAYCASKANDLVGSLWGLTAAMCTGTAAAAGIALSEITVPFGVIMAMAVGFLGFLTLGLLIIMTNSRIFKTDATSSLWFIGSFGISELPLVGTIPAFSIAIWKLYKTQIRVEGEALAKWNTAHQQEAAAAQQERQQQAAQVLLARNAQTEQIQEQEEQESIAEEEAEEDSETEAADDYYDEIPDEVREAA